VEEFIERSKPWVAPELGEWTPSTAGPPWPAERFDADTFARLAPLVQERVATLGEVPAMVDFIFLADPPTTSPVRQRHRARRGGGRHPGRGGGVYSHCEWRAADLHDLTLEMAERLGKKLARPRRRSGWRSPAARSARRSSRRSSARPRRVLRRLQAALALRAARVGTGPPG